jgi:predicted Zn-dependent protease
MADAAFFEELIDLYRLNGQPEKSEECAKITIDALLSDNISAAKDKSLGHYSDMELSHLYLKTNQLDKALQHAMVEQQRRPDNIDACETLARVYFKMGKPAEAAALLETALRTKSQKPERLALAGQVKNALGQQAEGEALIAQGMALKPYMEQ